MPERPRPPATPLSEAICLAHTIDGVALRVVTAGGRELLVSRTCLGADLDPCQLRSALIASSVGRPLAAIRSIEIAGGLVHLGGGLYQRASPFIDADERWFVTSLDVDRLTDLLEARHSPSASDDAYVTTLMPDPGLGLTAVRIVAGGRTAGGRTDDIDEVATAILSAVLVAELIDSIRPAGPAAADASLHPTNTRKSPRT